MTRDEVRSIIAKEIGWKLITPKRYTPNQYAEAVLAAFAARGIVLGEKVQEGDRVPAIVKTGSVILSDSFALVRVVQ